MNMNEVSGGFFAAGGIKSCLVDVDDVDDDDDDDDG
jgi:hypothetical protein